MSANQDLLSALTKTSCDVKFRYVLYKESLEDLLNRVFLDKNAGVNQWYYIYQIPSVSERDIEDYQFYSQKECCQYVCEQLREKGFFAKTLNGATAVFMSWHPKHLEHLAESKRKEEQQQQQQQKEMTTLPTKEDMWKNVTTRAKIQLPGGKAHLQSNRQRLASFFLSRGGT